jgi:hypothetical protein
MPLETTAQEFPVPLQLPRQQSFDLGGGFPTTCISLVQGNILSAAREAGLSFWKPLASGSSCQAGARRHLCDPCADSIRDCEEQSIYVARK